MLVVQLLTLVIPGGAPFDAQPVAAPIFTRLANGDVRHPVSLAMVSLDRHLRTSMAPGNSPAYRSAPTELGAGSFYLGPEFHPPGYRPQ
jgi:hypothetical protein